MKESCPGSKEITNPSPDDLKCIHCGAVNEIWSDEPDTTCHSCKKTIDREMKTNCLMWCPAAKECVGSEKYEKLTKAMKS